MIVYFSFFFIFIILSLYYNTKESLVLIVLFLFLLAIIIGLRTEGVDRDYSVYLNNYIFESYDIGRYISGKSFTNEPGFSLISGFITKNLSLHYIYIFIIVAIFSITVKSYAFYKIEKKYFIYSLLIWYANQFFLYDMTQLRAGIALAIYLLAINDIYNQNFKSFFIKIVFCFCFHYSSFILFFTYFLHKRTKISYLISYLVPVFILIILSIFVKKFSILDKRLVYYAEKQAINYANPLIFLRICILILTFSSENMKDHKYSFYVNLYLYGIFIFYILHQFNVFALRLSQLVFVIDPIAIPYMLFKKLPKKISQLGIYFISISLFVANLYLIQIVNKLSIINIFYD